MVLIWVNAKDASETIEDKVIEKASFNKTARQLGTAARSHAKMTPVGFEPTHPKIVELESTALDHSAKVSITTSHSKSQAHCKQFFKPTIQFTCGPDIT